MMPFGKLNLELNHLGLERFTGAENPGRFLAIAGVNRASPAVDEAEDRSDENSADCTKDRN